MSETVKVTAKTTAKKSAAKRTNVVSLTRSRESPKTVNSPPDQTLNLQKTVGNQAMLRFAQSCPLTLPSPSLCPTGGVCHTCPVRVQPKLTIGKPGDKYEQEADRVAEQVMSIPEPRIRRQVEPEEEEAIKTKPIAEQITPLVQRQTEPEEEEEEEEPIQAKGSSSGTPGITPTIESSINSLKGGGQPLPKSIRNYFEPRFGYDFSQIRVHTDNRANEAAKSVNAKAFTTGKDIVFAIGQYRPATEAGKKLLTHELTHVIQQSQNNVLPNLGSIKDKDKFDIIKSGINHQIKNNTLYIQRQICHNPLNTLDFDLRSNCLHARVRGTLNIRSHAGRISPTTGRLNFYNRDNKKHKIKISHLSHPFSDVRPSSHHIDQYGSGYSIVTLHKKMSLDWIIVVLTTGRNTCNSRLVHICP